MQLFYTPDISSQIYNLDKEESAHCVRVLRLKEGDELFLTDGIGNLYRSKLLSADLKSSIVEVVECLPDYGKKNFELHIAIAPTKNIDRFEWFLEKSTEIGISQITPLFCEHSERTVIKAERLEKIIISAMKQSIKAFRPKLNEAIAFKQFVNLNHKFTKYIAHCENFDKKSLKSVYKKAENALILIGPEGDFSLTEIKMAIEKKYIAVSLGESRLRTETAGLVACHTINLINEY